MRPDPESDAPLSPVVATRRVVLAGAGVAALAVLTGCTTYDTGGGGATEPSTGPLAQTSDVPVGGGFINARRGVVITQPKAGTYLGFSAECTHQGCTVGEVRNGTIICPCHLSKFNIADGSVAEGPANRALKPVPITVDGTSILPA